MGPTMAHSARPWHAPWALPFRPGQKVSWARFGQPPVNTMRPAVYFYAILATHLPPFGLDPPLGEEEIHFPSAGPPLPPKGGWWPWRIVAISGLMLALLCLCSNARRAIGMSLHRISAHVASSFGLAHALDCSGQFRSARSVPLPRTVSKTCNLHTIVLLCTLILGGVSGASV